MAEQPPEAPAADGRPPPIQVEINFDQAAPAPRPAGPPPHSANVPHATPDFADADAFILGDPQPNPFKSWLDAPVSFLENNGWYLLLSFIVLWFFKSKFEAFQASRPRFDRGTIQNIDEDLRKRREEQAKNWQEQAKVAMVEEKRKKEAKKQEKISRMVDKYDQDRHFKPDRVSTRLPPPSGGGGSSGSLTKRLRQERRPPGGGG
eukprot:g45643.t1